MTTFSICLSSFLPKVEIRSQKSISVRFFGGKSRDKSGSTLYPPSCGRMHFSNIYLSLYRSQEPPRHQKLERQLVQISKLSRGLFLFVLLLRKSLERELGTKGLTVEKEMDTAFSNMKTKLCSSFQLIGSSKVSHFSTKGPSLGPQCTVFHLNFRNKNGPKIVYSITGLFFDPVC